MAMASPETRNMIGHKEPVGFWHVFALHTMDKTGAGSFVSKAIRFIIV
jgi:hypothetical protein